MLRLSMLATVLCQSHLSSHRQSSTSVASAPSSASLASVVCSVTAVLFHSINSHQFPEWLVLHPEIIHFLQCASTIGVQFITEKDIRSHSHLPATSACLHQRPKHLWCRELQQRAHATLNVLAVALVGSPPVQSSLLPDQKLPYAPCALV